tara:strand:- start:1586 stop:1747 length:162 start_codon:yes stop_codon:yes gene_type:complete
MQNLKTLKIAPTKIVPLLSELDKNKLSWSIKQRILKQLEGQVKLFKVLVENNL